MWHPIRLSKLLKLLSITTFFMSINNGKFKCFFYVKNACNKSKMTILYQYKNEANSNHKGKLYFYREINTTKKTF